MNNPRFLYALSALMMAVGVTVRIPTAVPGVHNQLGIAARARFGRKIVAHVETIEGGFGCSSGTVLQLRALRRGEP